VKYLDLLSDFLIDFDDFDLELRSELTVRECDLDLLLEWCRSTQEHCACHTTQSKPLNTVQYCWVFVTKLMTMRSSQQALYTWYH